MLSTHIDFGSPDKRPPKFDREGPSMAEHMQNLVPDAIVVKAMNTLSAYALSRGLVQGSKQVFFPRFMAI